MEKIKILNISPVISTIEKKSLLEDRKQIAKNIDEKTRGLIKLETIYLDKGVVSIEDSYDEALSIPYMLKKVKGAEEKGYSAIVIGCFADPGLDAARELVKIPVLGANESSCHLAVQLASRFSIINILPELELKIRSLIAKYGFLQHLSSIKTINMPVLDLIKDSEKSITKISEEAENAVKLDRAYAIVLGCTGMSTLVSGVKKRLESKGINAPVIEPLRAAIYNAITWCLMDVSQSKEAYPQPREKLRII